MALAMRSVHSDQCVFGPGPTENDLPVPPMFYCMEVANKTTVFDQSAELHLPRGCGRRDRPPTPEERAPLPRASTNSAYGINTTCLRSCLTAYKCAKGMTYFNQTFQLHETASTMWSSTEGELKAAIEHKMAHLSDSARAGPHNSCRPRCLAVTLLLPRSTQTKTSPEDSRLLDGYAAISQVIQHQPNASQPRSDSGNGTTGGSTNDHPNTSSFVRMNVLCGADDVSSFLSNSSVAQKTAMANMEWRKHAAVCVSFLSKGHEIKTAHARVDDSGVLSNESAVLALQSTMIKIQQMHTGSLVLPSSCVHAECVDVSVTFLGMEHDLQWEFKKLICPDPEINVPAMVLDSYKNVSNGVQSVTAPQKLSEKDGQAPVQRLVRLANAVQDVEGNWTMTSPNLNTLGFILSTDGELCQDYVRRCRLLQPRQPFHTEWPVFGLHPPTEEERYANIAVMYARVSTAFIGCKLSLFYPRRKLGACVTEYEGSGISKLQSVLEPIENVLRMGMFVLPCTVSSTVPRTPNASAASAAFIQFMSDARNSVLGIQCDASGADARLLSFEKNDVGADLLMKEPLQSTDTSFGRETPTSSAIVLNGSGHPCTTCGEVYDAFHHEFLQSRTGSSAFYTVVDVACRRWGRSTPIDDVMNACASSISSIDLLDVPPEPIHRTDSLASELSTNGRESPKKRARTPTAISTPADATRRFVVMGRENDSFSLLKRLIKLSASKRMNGIAFPLKPKKAVSMCDALEDVFFPFGSPSTLRTASRDEKKAMFDNVDAVDKSDELKLPVRQIESILNSIMERLSEPTAPVLLHLIVCTHITDENSPVMYTANTSTAPIKFSESLTVALLEEPPEGTRVAVIDVHKQELSDELQLDTLKTTLVSKPAA